VVVASVAVKLAAVAPAVAVILAVLTAQEVQATVLAVPLA